MRTATYASINHTPSSILEKETLHIPPGLASSGDSWGAIKLQEMNHKFPASKSIVVVKR